MNPFSNPEFERTVLASLLEYPETAYQALALGLRAEHFSEQKNRVLFQSILRLSEAGHPIGFETIVSDLQKNPGPDKLVAALDDITNFGCIPRKDIGWHVRELQNIGRRKALAEAFKKGISAVEDPNETTDACVEYAHESLLKIEGEAMSGQAAHAKDFIPDVLRELESRAGKKGLIGLGTGIGELNEATTGIRPGELWVVGALSGRGKTALGTQVASANARAGMPVAIFSLEMRKDEIGCRLLSNESSISASRIRNPNFINKEQWMELATSAEQIMNWPLYIDDSPTLTLSSLVARARLYIRRYGCQLIVVDYIRLINAPGRELREQVGNATDALRQLAKTEGVGIVALSQLARPKDGKLNTRPSMINLKESGDIEAHAHVVVLIYMPMKQGEPTGKDEIIIAKNRHGPVGTIEVEFDRERLKFLPRSGKEAEGSSAPNTPKNQQESLPGVAP